MRLNFHPLWLSHTVSLRLVISLFVLVLRLHHTHLFHKTHPIHHCPRLTPGHATRTAANSFLILSTQQNRANRPNSPPTAIQGITRRKKKRTSAKENGERKRRSEGNDKSRDARTDRKREQKEKVHPGVLSLRTQLSARLPRNPNIRTPLIGMFFFFFSFSELQLWSELKVSAVGRNERRLRSGSGRGKTMSHQLCTKGKILVCWKRGVQKCKPSELE